MKIKFDNLKYQEEAINSICDLFKGSSNQNFNSTNFEYGLLNINPNKLDFSDELISRNFNGITKRNGLGCLNGYNNSLKSKNKFEVEMETGTGKTFVFLSTIFELNKRYGLSKFIIFVPSIAIREGIKKTIEQTKEYFQSKYNNKLLDTFVWNSKASITEIRNFAQSNQDNLINVMITTIQSFRSKGKNIVHQENETLGGENCKPIDFLNAVRPVIIVDEPQITTSADASVKVIDEYLKPLFIISYSATHKKPNNLVYRLSAFDAYSKKLVKKIVLSSTIKNEISNTKPLVRLLNIKTKENLVEAKVELQCFEKNKFKTKIVTINKNTDLYKVTNNPLYQDGYTVEQIKSNEQKITFSNGVVIYQDSDAISDNEKRLLIERLIETHLKKEVENLKYGVKTLSLFFIDKVERYRLYDDENKPIQGDYARWFEEIYQSVISKKENKSFVDQLPDDYKDLKNINISKFHDGYFSIDKKSSSKDELDSSTFDLILKDKEKLLSLDNKLRFIFSHSALREGWDNPNVFNICVLKDGAKNEISRRQEIGRGLRLCVNQQGERLGLDNYYLNKLNIISNESYETYIDHLQKEIDENLGSNKIISIDYNDKISKDLKEKVINYLVSIGYIEQGKVQKKLIDNLKINNLIDLKTGLNLDDYANELMNNWIKEQIEFSETKIIKNQNKLIDPILNSKKYEEFKPILKSLKTPHYFKIEDDIFDISELSKIIENEVKTQLKINDNKVTYANFDIENYGSSNIKQGKCTDIEDYYLNNKYDIQKLSPKIKETFRLYYLNDILKNISYRVNLKISTIDKIIKNTDTLNQIFRNREQYRDTLIRIFEDECFKYLSNNKIYKTIEYEFLDHNFYLDEVSLLNSFKEEIEIDEQNKDYIFQDDSKINKSLFNAFKLQSKNEVDVANFFNSHSNVSMFTKLPFLNIKMPFSKYNPDWFVKMQNNDLVIESKVSLGVKNIKLTEQFKIDLFAQFIDQLNQELKTNIIFETITKNPTGSSFSLFQKSKNNK